MSLFTQLFFSPGKYASPKGTERGPLWRDFTRKLLAPSKFKRFLFFLISDTFIILLSFYISFLFRFEFSFPQEYLQPFCVWALGVLALKLLLLMLLGLYSISWRFVGITELRNLALLFSISTTVFLTVNLILRKNLPAYDIPFSIIFIDLLFSFFLISLFRISKRFYLDMYKPGKRGKSTLIIGANTKSRRIINELRDTPYPPLHPVAIIDDNPNTIDTKIEGIPVSGNMTDIKKIIRKKNIETILICEPEATQKKIKSVFTLSKEAGIDDIKIAPRFSDYRNNVNIIKNIKNIDISDLLFRDPVKIDFDMIKKNLSGKSVLVTGAAGSIGSEITAKLVKFGTENVIAFDMDETGIYNLSNEIKGLTAKTQNIFYIVGDVRDSVKLEKTFEQFKPDIVFHSAAYKHVPLMDKFPEEAIKTNIFGTKTLAEISSKFKVERFINISTDKAVNPVSMMGITKRIGEQICLTHNIPSTRFMSVRFGNVIGSRGSVIPLFLKQIEEGGPVTITHPEMKRYFMSIPEAVLLVFQAGFLGNGAEVFLLDMGEPVKIKDLAEKLIQLNGLKPREDIEIVFTGVRSGEKLFEELLTNEESTQLTKHEKIFICKNENHVNLKQLNSELKKLKTNLYNNRKVNRILTRMVPSCSIQN